MPREKRKQSGRSQGVLAKYWWVFLFVATCGGVYSHALQKKTAISSQLQQQYALLVQEKEAVEQRFADLSLQINSQSDPAWIELMLMKGLGLVPEGQLKVYFHDDDSVHPDSVKM